MALASTFTGRLQLSIEAREMLANAIQAGQLPTRFVKDLDLRNGTADGKINKAFYKRETGIAASTTTVYDLVGSLTDTSGATVNFDEVVLILVHNLSATAANYLTVGPDATNGFGVVSGNKGFWADASDRNVVQADQATGVPEHIGGSWLLLYAYSGVSTAAGSTDELAVITQGGTSANTWEILILGRDN